MQPFLWRLMPEPKPEKWIFIVGCYNSGTTLLHQVLSQHPKVGSMPNEGQFFNTVLPSGHDFGLRRLWAIKPEIFHLTENTEGYDVEKLKKQWAWMYNHSSRPYLIEKTILHSARVRWLQHHFPRSYFIAIMRNGYAVAEGIHRKEKHAIEKCMEQWAVSNQILLDDLQHVERKYILKYEDFTASPLAAIHSITDFLEIEPLNKEALNKKFTVHKMEGEISNQNAKSLSNLSKEEILLMNGVGKEMMEKLGYEVK